MRRDRTRLAIGAAVSILVHGILFGAVPSWVGEGEEIPTGPPEQE